ncbi:DNA-binding protein [Streptacidiphilus monticola]|uniref:DNA-binding protein n=1 Tax=Streptacidiphilus monticola TaxID=2161674 RepID=A0ABW1GAB3_9ACTN
MRLTTGQAAGQLGMTGAPLRKLIATGLVPDVLDRPKGQVFPLAALDALKSVPMADLSTLPGPTLAVLRTGPAAAAPDDDPAPEREWIGFGAGLTADQLLAASDRWWRCDPERVAAGRYLAVTVGEFVVAVLTGLEQAVHNGAPATMRRWHFTRASLLGWVTDLTDSTARTISTRAAAEDQAIARQLLGCRLPSESGGPIAYVPAGPSMGVSAEGA